MPMSKDVVETLTGRVWDVKFGQIHLLRGSEAVCGELKEVVHVADGQSALCARCVEVAAAGDFVTRRRTSGGREYTWPMLGVHGTGCGGYKDVSWKGTIVKRPDVAFQIALMQYGYRMRDWDNYPPACACGCEAWLKEVGDVPVNLGVLSDTGWKGVAVGRCVTDYTRTLCFAGRLMPDQQELLRKYVQLNRCPGWTDLRVVVGDSGARFTFTTTMDSSD